MELGSNIDLAERIAVRAFQQDIARDDFVEVLGQSLMHNEAEVLALGARLRADTRKNPGRTRLGRAGYKGQVMRRIIRRPLRKARFNNGSCMRVDVQWALPVSAISVRYSG